MVRYFLDTCALLNLQEKAFTGAPFVISGETLRELESIKVSAHKDAGLKYRARYVTRLLIEHDEAYEVCDSGTDLTGDERIRLDAECAARVYDEPIVFVSDDLACRLLVRYDVFEDVVGSDSLAADEDHYTGYKVLQSTDEELVARFYEDLSVNTAQCDVNEYVVIVDEHGTAVDAYRWTETDGYKGLYNKTLKSQFLNDTKPKDLFQRAAIDSIMNNMVTCIAGPAGSGKSLLALACALQLIRLGKYDRIVMLANPTKAYGASDLGFYPGTAYEKLMANSVGNMLATKFGDCYGVEMLVNQDKLKLVSMADVRGMEIRENEILYISECQNTTVDLMKLCLSRVSEGAKVILEGDYATQVDSRAYMGHQNGMRRVIETLKGSPLFGYVELQRVWRSALAALVDAM